MSDSPESKNSINNPAVGAPAPASGNFNAAANPAPVTEATPTPQGQPAPAQPGQQFKAENIGSWASHQEGYFAEQNRKDAAKREKAEQTRKKVLPIIFVVGGVIAAALLIWGIVALVVTLIANSQPEIPAIAGGTSEDIGDYRNVLQEFYVKNNGDLSAVEEAVNDVLNTREGREYADQIRMSQASFLMANGYNAEAAAVGSQIDPDSLSTEQRSMLYALLAVIYANLGDTEKASAYEDLMYENNLQLGGDGGA